MNIFAIVKLLMQILPMIHPIVVLVEQLFPNAGNSAAKLDSAVNLVQGVLTGAGVEVDPAMKPAIAGAVNAVVAAVNASGGFGAQGSATAPIGAP